MPGTQIFTYANFGKETVRGTPVAPTRQFYAEGTGVLDHDLGLNFHEGENTGSRGRIRRATSQSEDVNLKIRTVSGVGYDDLVIAHSFLNGTAAFTGGAADKTLVSTPSRTATNAPLSYSVDVGDDTQNWRVQYAMARSFKVSAALGDVTSLEMDMFGQRAIKGAKASPATNSAVKIVGDTWTIKYATTFATLGAASVQANFLVSWDLEVMTGLRNPHYMDGTLYFGQHVETDIGGTFSGTVESTALAVSEIYDKYAAATMDFVRIKNTGPTLGGTNYSCQYDFPILWDKPEIIGEQRDGINLYKFTGHLADDGTNLITPTLVQSLTAYP